MKSPGKFILLAIVLIAVSTYLTAYTFTAHGVATMHIFEDAEAGVALWRSGPAGSLFPWPREPGMLQVLTEMSEVDTFIYVHFVKSWLLVGASLLLWFVSGLSIFLGHKGGHFSR